MGNVNLVGGSEGGRRHLVTKAAKVDTSGNEKDPKEDGSEGTPDSEEQNPENLSTAAKRRAEEALQDPGTYDNAGNISGKQPRGQNVDKTA